MLGLIELPGHYGVADTAMLHSCQMQLFLGQHEGKAGSTRQASPAIEQIAHGWCDMHSSIMAF